MKILSLSDLHVDISYSEEGISLLPYIVEAIKEENPDIVIIAGDISDFSYQSIRIIEDIEKNTGVKVYFIPGNHDIWDDTDSWINYNLFKSHHSTLIDNPIILDNGYVIIGDMGWYDYSFKPSNIDNKTVNKFINLTNQGQFSKWNMSDSKLLNIQLEKLRLNLNKFTDYKIIFVNHFIPYDDFIIVKNDINWNIMNGMMGSRKIGDLINEFNNIEYVIFGHTHKRFPLIKRGNKKIICNPLGYAHEWLSKYSNQEKENNLDNIIKKEIRECLSVINI